MSETGFAAMGKPISNQRKMAALAHVREMWPGVTTDHAVKLVNRTADHLERDIPFQAFEEAKKLGLDLTGSYRLIAVLLAAPEKPDRPEQLECHSCGTKLNCDHCGSWVPDPRELSEEHDPRDGEPRGYA